MGREEVRRAEEVHRLDLTPADDHDPALAGKRPPLDQLLDLRGAGPLSPVGSLADIGGGSGTGGDRRTVEHRVDLTPDGRLVAGTRGAAAHRLVHHRVLHRANGSGLEGLVPHRGAAAAPPAALEAGDGNLQVGKRGDQDGDVHGAVLLPAEKVLPLDDEHGRVARIPHVELAHPRPLEFLDHEPRPLAGDDRGEAVGGEVERKEGDTQPGDGPAYRSGFDSGDGHAAPPLTGRDCFLHNNMGEHMYLVNRTI